MIISLSEFTRLKDFGGLKRDWFSFLGDWMLHQYTWRHFVSSRIHIYKKRNYCFGCLFCRICIGIAKCIWGRDIFLQANGLVHMCTVTCNLDGSWSNRCLMDLWFGSIEVKLASKLSNIAILMWDLAIYRYWKKIKWECPDCNWESATKDFQDSVVNNHPDTCCHHNGIQYNWLYENHIWWLSCE